MKPVVSFALALVGLLALVGCGKSGPAKKACFPVKGQLFVKGQPAAGAQVVLRPPNPDEWPDGFPRATVAADGSFDVETYGNKDGAPAGDYTVVVTWTVNAAKPDAEDTAMVDRLGGKYDPTNSKLSAKVEAGPTTLPAIRLP